MTLTVEVTQADIDAGTKESCERCPIALAVKRAIQSVMRSSEPKVEVGVYRVILNDQWPRPLLGFALPRTATLFIRRFDDDSPVSPFTFQVSVELPA